MTNYLDKQTQVVNICWVCGKPLGTWPDKVEAVCLKCLKRHKTFERLEGRRDELISMPFIFYDKNDINTNRKTTA